MHPQILTEKTADLDWGEELAAVTWGLSPCGHPTCQCARDPMHLLCYTEAGRERWINMGIAFGEDPVVALEEITEHVDVDAARRNSILFGVVWPAILEAPLRTMHEQTFACAERPPWTEDVELETLRRFRVAVHEGSPARIASLTRVVAAHGYDRGGTREVYKR